MSQTPLEAPPVHPGDIESHQDTFPPHSHLPQPDPDWLQQIGNVGESTASAVSPGVGAREPERSKSARKRRIPLKYQTAGALAGIAVIGFLQLSKDPSAVTDMLGTELVKLVPESAPISRPAQPAVDPRLADPVALDMLQLERGPETTAAIPSPGQVEQFESLPAVAEAPSEALGETVSEPHEIATEPAPSPSAPDIARPAVTANAAPSVSNEELMQRLQLLEGLVTQLVQQQQKAAAKATPSTAAAAPAAEPASTTATPAAAVQQRRPAPRANVAKAPAAKPAKQAKASAPAAQPAPALGGQLVSVDMWNGEASVVISSGLPGDRRVRVLRPGDVVNGMHLRSADPVTRSATFVAPGSQGLTLYVSQGG
nr:hypothetical protein [uncultured Comamonas sp.]